MKLPDCNEREPFKGNLMTFNPECYADIELPENINDYDPTKTYGKYRKCKWLLARGLCPMGLKPQDRKNGSEKMEQNENNTGEPAPSKLDSIINVFNRKNFEKGLIYNIKERLNEEYNEVKEKYNQFKELKLKIEKEIAKLESLKKDVEELTIYDYARILSVIIASKHYKKAFSEKNSFKLKSGENGGKMLIDDIVSEITEGVLKDELILKEHEKGLEIRKSGVFVEE